MLKTIFATVGFVSLAILISASAQALPVASTNDDASSVIQISEGCGPYGHRDRFGRCEPNGERRHFEDRRFEERRYIERRRPRCFMRETLFGPQRVCE